MLNCTRCGRRYYDGIVRECPARPGRQYCIYCCMKCKASRKVDTGWACDAEKMMNKEGVGNKTLVTIIGADFSNEADRTCIRRFSEEKGIWEWKQK